MSDLTDRIDAALAERVACGATGDRYRVGGPARELLNEARNALNSRPEFVRCGDCKEDWRYAINLMDGKPVWMPPKKKRGGCQHYNDSAEVALRDGAPVTAFGVALLAAGAVTAVHAGRVEHDAPGGWNTVAAVLVGSGCAVLAFGAAGRWGR